MNRLSRYAEALPSFDRAIDLDDGQKRDLYRLHRAVALAHTGDHVRATAEAREVSGRGSVSGSRLYSGACVHGLSIAAAGRDSGLGPAARQELVEGYASRAVELLAKAHTGGYFNTPALVEHLKKDPDLAPLRFREDFQKLLAQLEKLPKTGAK